MGSRSIVTIPSSLSDIDRTNRVRIDSQASGSVRLFDPNGFHATMSGMDWVIDFPDR